MNMNVLQQYRGELLRALNNSNYERTDDGRVFFPKAGLYLGGTFGHRVSIGNDVGPWSLDPNIVVNECLDDLLKVYFAASAAATTFYLAPFSGNVTPQATWTGSGVGTDFTEQATEFTAYNETTRPVWTPDAEASQTIANSAAPGRCTITSGPVTIRGAGLLSGSSAKGNHSTTKLHAATRFDADLINLPTAAKLDLEYIVTAADGG